MSRFLTNCFKHETSRIFGELTRGQPGRRLVSGEPQQAATPDAFPVSVLKANGMVGIYEVQAAVNQGSKGVGGAVDGSADRS